MKPQDDILELLREETTREAMKAQRAVILQPGAIGDCILTLPLAEFIKKSLGLGGVDVIGHTEYTGILPGRTCVDGVRCIDSMDLHRLFVTTKDFDLKDGDSLISAFSDYAWITTFLGEPDSDFEQNLIFTANCSHSAEVVTLLMKPPEDCSEHLTQFYTRQFAEQAGLSPEAPQAAAGSALIKATEADSGKGKQLLREIETDPAQYLVVIHPGSGGLHKCWHPDNYLAVAKKLLSQGLQVVFLLGPAETDRFSDEKLRSIINVAPCLTELTLVQVVGLLSCANVFIGNDSGITHLAAALGIKTLAVFGPTDPTVYRPIGPAVEVFGDNAANFAAEPSSDSQNRLLQLLRAS